MSLAAIVRKIGPRYILGVDVADDLLGDGEVTTVIHGKITTYSLFAIGWRGRMHYVREWRDELPAWVKFLARIGFITVLIESESFEGSLTYERLKDAFPYPNAARWKAP